MLGRGAKLAMTIWPTGMALHVQRADDLEFRERLGIQATAQRAVVAARYDQAIAHALCVQTPRWYA